MTWEQWRTLVALRWRLAANQFARHRLLHTIVLSVLFVGLVLIMFASLIVGVLLPWLLAKDTTPQTILLSWDVVICCYLVFWVFGLLTEVRQTELIVLDKLMHLPVSLVGAFLMNFCGSLISLTNAVFVPGMVGAVIGSLIAIGPKMLP